MLLLIALANMPWFLYGRDVPLTNQHHIDGSALDRVWQTIAIVAVDGRSYPLFAFLFGYGIWQLYARQRAAGADARTARRLLQRRHAWMVAFGAVHALLLWMGDIVGAYGIVGLLVTWLFLDRADRTLRRWCIVLTSVLLGVAVLGAANGALVAVLGIDAEAPSGAAFVNPNAMASYPESMLARLATWAVLTPMQGVVSLVVPIAVLVGIQAARHRVLEDPASHRTLLVRTAAIGVPVAWAGGVLALGEHLGAFPTPSWTFQLLHSVTGLAGGLGYAAIFGLVAAAWMRRGVGPVGRAVQAVGKRSLSSYVLQSVLFAPVLAAWGLGLGGVLAEWQGAVYAVGVWLVTVVVAVLLERAGSRGPLEWLLRRLAYRRGAGAPPTAVAAPPSP